MKYIRTKDGEIRIVIDPSEFDEENRKKIPDNCTMVDANNIYGCAIVENKNIIKQSDNLEELCDEFVLVNLEYFGQVNPKHYDTLYELKTKNSFEQEGGISLAIKGGWYAIYGAIWTKEGLIYVTKLNEKGELEVL